MSQRERWLRRVQRSPKVEVELPKQATEETPLVPFVPVRCPRCRAGQPHTYGVRDLKAGCFRYHLCQECQLKFRSLELDATHG
jgi:hypothetical protein